MKKLVFAMMIMSFSLAAFAGGKVIGNGGNNLALEFSQSANQAIKELKDNPASYPEVVSVDLQKIADSAEILVSDLPVYSVKGDVRQFSTIINYKNPDTVVIYGPRWDSIKNAQIRKALAMHEILSLAGIETTGDYSISKRYLKNSGINCSVGLCEDLSRYSCLLKKLDSNNIEKIIANGEIGNKGSDNEIVDIFGENMKATVLMNTAVAQGHIMLILYRDGKKVGLTEIRGSVMPPFLLLQWKNPEARETWSLNCQQF